MIFRRKITVVLLSISLVLNSQPLHADWIGDFYASAGAAVNATAPQSIATQSAVGYSGGGLVWRVPNKNFTPLQISPPSIKAGCGGIDAYLGGFSFPNKDAFVQSLRNFGQAAVGYFFQLALRTMAPEIAVTLDVINDLATRVNQFSMNSCRAAQAAVDSLAKPLLEKHARDATGFARSAGLFVDEFDAMFNIQGNGQRIMEQKYSQNYGKPRSAVTRADQGKSEFVYGNLLRWALDHGNSVALTESEKDLVMSLVGPTVIVRKGTSTDGDESLDFSGGRPRTISFKHLVGEDSLTTTVVNNLRVLTCSDPECTVVTESSQSIRPFTVRASDAVMAIRRNIQNRTGALSLSAEELVVINLSSVPLYRAAAMSEGTGIAAVVAGQMVNDLVDYTAVDAAYNMVYYYLGIAESALNGVSAKIPQILVPSYKAMKDDIVSVRQEVTDTVNQFYKRKGDPFLKIDQLDKVERAMYSNLNSMLAANARFGKRL